MGIFKRLFNIGKAEAHSKIDKLEDPIKMTEQGIRDLKGDLRNSIEALAEVKALAIRSRNEVNNYKENASRYEGKAIQLIKRAESGSMAVEEADRLATAALQKKEDATQSYKVASANQIKYDQSVAKLESNIKMLKSKISKWENEAKMLKARAKVSKATKNVNKQLANIDSSSTVAMLERMKEKVDQEEALAESYAEIANENKSLDDEIDSALEGSDTSASDSLAALKAKLAHKQIEE